MAIYRRLAGAAFDDHAVKAMAIRTSKPSSRFGPLEGASDLAKPVCDMPLVPLLFAAPRYLHRNWFAVDTPTAASP